jgi:hypothetical protein
MIELKRGDTLAFLVKRKTPNGAPMSGDAEKLRAQVRDKEGVLMAEFGITETEELGTYLFSIPATTTAIWKPSIYQFDIEYQDGGIVTSSQTMEIKLIKDVTRDD